MIVCVLRMGAKRRSRAVVCAGSLDVVHEIRKKILRLVERRVQLRFESRHGLTRLGMAGHGNSRLQLARGKGGSAGG